MKYRCAAAFAGAALMSLSSAAVAQQHDHQSPSAGPQPQEVPAEEGRDEADVPPVDHSQMSRTNPQPPAARNARHSGEMTAALGPYPMMREASGTAWQPDTSEHMGLMTHSGDWMLMGHGMLNLVYDHQGGRRGDDKLFASGMLMGMARRPIGDGALQFRAALSPDPLMGKRGYPLLLASGETADGEEHLIDRQHPHDFFMELSASVSQNLGSRSSVFLYAGLPGEPAFGPPAFMHREAIMDSPEAPISHHWLDSTHITFGVVTAGMVIDRFKIELSRFNGREPDQHRWNIETGPLDSTAVRVSLNPTRTLAIQGSWGKFKGAGTARTGCRPEKVVGQRLMGERGGSRLEAGRHARLGTEIPSGSSWGLGERRCLRRRGIGETRSVDRFCSCRKDREPRIARAGRRSRPRIQGRKAFCRGCSGL
jgi:hypothetical protein